MEEVSTEETSEELIAEEEPVVALEGEEGLLGATSHKACASCQANLTLTMHTNNSSWYQSIVNNRVTAKNHALNDGYSGACASFVSYLLIDAGISGVSATPSCENLYSQLKNGAGGYTEIGAGMTPAAGPGNHVIMVGQPSDSPGFYSSSINEGDSYLCYPGKPASNVATSRALYNFNFAHRNLPLVLHNYIISCIILSSIRDSSHLTLSFNLSKKSRKIHCKDY